jgi:lysophospholipase L1-like esterase
LAGQLLLSCVALAFGCAAAELAARAYYGGKRALTAAKPRFDPRSGDAFNDPSDFYGRYDTFATVEYHPFLGYVPIPKHRGNGYYTNVHHCRHDEDFPAEKPAGERRVFVLGGSTAWGAAVRQEDLYTAWAERRLRAREPRRRSRVVAAGVRSYCSVQERIFAENLLVDLSPDVIVLFTGWNDSYFGYSGTDTPRYVDQMGFGQAVARSAELQSQRITAASLQPPVYEDYDLKLRFLWDVARYKLRYGTPQALARAIEGQALPLSRVTGILERNAAILADLGRRQGFTVVLYLQPSIYCTAKTLSAWEREVVRQGETTYIGFPDYNRRAYGEYRRRLPEQAQRAGYVFVDGDEAIRAERLGVFADHVHFGSRGQQRIGEHLAEALAGLAEGRKATPE